MSIVTATTNNRTYANAALLMALQVQRRVAKRNQIKPMGNRYSCDEIQPDFCQASLPHTVSILEPHEQVFQYFSRLWDRNRVLKGIDLIWQNEYLFNSDNYFRKHHLKHLQNIVAHNEDYFARGVDDHTNSRFQLEFDKLLNSNLDTLTKCICLTQAVELALMGVLVTQELANINSQTGANSHGTQKGYRQELLAGWFVAKFLYPELSDSESPYQIRLSTRYKSKSGSSSKKRKEIDIITPNALVEVKSSLVINNPANQFVDEIMGLYKFVIAQSAELKEKVNRLIIISGSDNELDWIESDDRITKYEQLALDEITSYKKNIDAASDAYRRKFLNGVNKTELYYIAPASDNYLVREWIQFVYDHYSGRSGLELIA